MKLIDTTFHLEGVTPLLMHNVRMANPLDKFARAVSELTARKKGITLEEFATEKARLQFLGSLYWEEGGFGLHMPGYNVFKAFVEGARLSKNGVKLEQGILDYTPKCGLDPYTARYDDPEKLFVDGHELTTMVKIGQSTVPSTRPQFVEWKLSITFAHDPGIADVEMLHASGVAAGKYKGLGDGRLKGFGKGRFNCEVAA